MKISEFRKVLSAIEECDDSIKSINIHGFQISQELLPSKYDGSKEMVACLQGAIIQRKHNLIEQLARTGVNVSEVV